jgi:septum formation protein
MSDLVLYLASASPRRLELLRSIGLDPLVRPVGVDERAKPGESPTALVTRLAEAKARAAHRELEPSARAGLVLGVDTTVVLDGLCLGKPARAEEAEAMLRRLRGRTHEVVTGVCLLRTDDGAAVVDFETTRVRFREYDDTTIRAYVASGEPLDKAGAYGIQGGGARLAAAIEGSWSNVVGLPLERLPGWLERLRAEPTPPGG